MSDVNANIGVHIDTSAALAELKTLQRQIATFHSSIAKNSAASAAAQKGLQTNLLNAINATGKFHAQMGLVRTSTESFTHALENNKLSMREYFRYAGASTKSFGKLFKSEFDTIGKVAEERVRKMQTQFIKMGRDASGATKAMSITPATLNMKDFGNQAAVASQKQAIFNQLVKQGSTSLLNFGKNTQWAGRQLMVGFSVPLMYIGSIASKTFMEMEEQAIRFKRVYGDIFTTAGETEKAVKEIELLAKSFTKYGVALTDTMKMAAEAAAMGKTGAELTAQVAEATRLAVLGGVEQQQALETTISLTNAFGISADQLASKINFLNAVENQTVVSIEDLTIAIPKAGPVIQQLGGSVEDLAFFLTAMKEGGINASEGANALKSGLASLINPTKKASEMLGDLGINIKGIVEANAGNLKGTVVGFAQALDTLDPLNRARAIEQLFGKFQFARLSTLFQNITQDGTQANKVLGLTQASVEELAILSQRELKKVEDAVGTNFKQSIEDLKIAIMPIGKAFLEALTPIVKFAGDLLKKFDGLGDGTKKFIVVATTLVGIIGPTLLMTFGLVANGAANIIKLFLALRTGFLKLGGNAKVLSEQTGYLNVEQLEAATVAASLNQAHTRLTQSFALEASAVKALRNAYIEATIAATNFARANPGMMMPGFGGRTPKKFAGGATYVPGSGNKDTVASMLTPGEAVIPKKVAQNPAYQPIIDAMVNGNLKAFGTGTTGVSFGGKEYNAKTARGANNIKTFLDELIKNQDGTLTYIDPKTKETSTFSQKRLREIFDYRSREGKEFTASDIKRSLNIGSGQRGRSAGTSSPSWVRKLVQEAVDKDKTIFAEKEFLKNTLKEKGIALTQTQERNMFGIDASHIEKAPTPDGKKVWKASNIVPDAAYINKYINDQVHNTRFGQSLQRLSDIELANLGIDRTELNKLVSEGSHPTTSKSAITLSKIADYQKSQYPTSPTIYQAEMASAGIGYRLKTGVYGSGLKTLADRFPGVQTNLEDSDPKGIFAQADEDVKKSRFKNEPVAKYGRQLSQSSGYSFREANHLSGVFEKPDGSRVFVKPMMDERAALAEQRATIIARDVHGLDAPVQSIKVIEDYETGKKLFALESPYDPKFAESNFTGKFTKQEYFKQLVAANLRGDKDLHKGNLSGNVLADVGTAGVFEKASGKRDFATKMPSMAEQANINLLGIKGGAKRFFAEATLDIPKGMTADQYHNSMIKEIDTVLPKLKNTIAGFDLNPVERQAYQGMITRLEEARKVDWRSFHKIHSGVAVAVQKKEAILDKTGKETKISGQNTTALPKGVKPSTGRPDDSRLATLKPGSSVVTPTPGKFRVIPGKADAAGVSSLMGMSQSDFAARTAAMKNGVNALVENTAQTKQTTNRIKELGNKGNVAIGALSGLTIAGTFAGGKLGEMSNSIMPFVFGAQGVAGIMSMMPKTVTKMQGGMIAATAVIGTFVTVTALLNKAYNDAQNKAMQLSEATGASAKAIENFAVFANKATPGQILDERNKQARSPFTTKAGKTSFGEAYVAAPDNAAILKEVANNIKTDPKKAMQDLTNQLSVAIASGVFTPEQARSVAVNIGEQLGNINVGLQASASLSALYGSDGSNLLKDPLTIRVNLMEEATKGIAGNAKNLGSAGSAINGGSMSAMNKNVAVGGTVAAGAGAGALIGSVAGPIGTVVGAAVGGIAAGAATLISMKKTAEELGALSGIAVQNQQNALNVNKEMTASVQLYYENLIKTKNAEGDIAGAKEAQSKYDAARAKLAEKNAETVKAIADSYKNTAGQSQKALVDAAKKATGTKYKDTFQEQYVSTAQKGLADLNIGNRGKKGQMEYVLTMQMNAGNIEPSDMLNIIQTFGKDEKSMDKVMTIISKFGGAKAAETQQILGAFVDKNGNPNTKAQTEFLANVSTAKTSAEADKLIDFYGAVAQNQGILDVGLMVNYFQNNPEAAARLQGLLDELKKNEGKLTYDVVTNFLPPKGDAAINKEYFDKLNQAQKAVYIQEIATIVSMSEAQIKKSKDFEKWLSLADEKTKSLPFAQQVAKYADAMGQKVTEQRVDLSIATPTNVKDTPTGTKVRDTTLDELLKKLKFVRDAAIDAEGNIKDLVKLVSGNGITKFAGVSQQLMAGNKGGYNREFISMLESMDNKTRAIYMTEKDGIVTLTKKGKALKEAYNEKVIGEYQNSQIMSVQNSVAQQAAFIKLKAAGVDTSIALELVADANQAVAINGKSITKTEIEALAKAAAAAKNPVSNLALELQKVANAAKLKLDDINKQIKTLTEAKDKFGFNTEDLKIISDSPELMNALAKLLNGDGTRAQLGQLEQDIKNTINNTKGAKVAIEGDFTKLTEGIAFVAQKAFDEISSAVSKAFATQRAVVEKDYRDDISAASDVINEIKSRIDDSYKDGKIIPGLQSAVDNAQSMIDDAIEAYENQIQTIEDKYFKQSLDAAGNVVITGLLAGPQAEIDRLTASIDNLQNLGNINAIGLTGFGAAAAGNFKGVNLTIAEAEKAISDVQAFIEETYDEPIKLAQRFIAGTQRNIELSFTRPIEKLQSEIESIQRKIAVEFDKPLTRIQEESSKLSEDLTVMDHAAEAINKKYSDQETALSKISEINQDIVEQQRQQLGLADALSKGDISAAASAMQEIRASQSAKALASRQGTLNAAKEAELAAIKSPSGLTRDQIAEKQYVLERSSYQIQQLQKIEQEKILAIQERIYLLENNPERLKLIQDIKLEEDKIYNLEQLKIQANDAILAVQSQISNNNRRIAAEQAALATAEANLKKIQDAREADLKKAELAHKNTLIGLETALKNAQEALKKANDELILAEAALKAIEDKKAAALKAIEKEETAFNDLALSIDVATASAKKFGDQLEAAKKHADDLINALNGVSDAKSKQLKDEADAKKKEEADAKLKLEAEQKEITKANLRSMHPGLPPYVLNSIYPDFAPFASGGIVPKYFASGGFNKGTDTIPAMLTPGEFVIKKSAVDDYGVNNLAKINRGSYPDSSVYNYSLSVSVNGNNLNPDDIANTVIQKIKYIDGQRIRGQR